MNNRLQRATDHFRVGLVCFDVNSVEGFFKIRKNAIGTDLFDHAGPGQHVDDVLKESSILAFLTSNSANYPLARRIPATFEKSVQKALHYKCEM